VRAIDERWSKGAILCRGSGANGAWTYNPRPPGENIMHLVKAIGAN
jgi:hypothetical protein